MPNPSEDTATVRVRIATLADADAVRAFKRLALGETEYLLQGLEDYDDRVAAERELIGRFLNQANCMLLVAVTAGGRVAAICSVVGGHLYRTRHVGTMSVAVLSPFWGQGLATRLMRDAMAWAEANPLLTKLSLQVHASNAPARRLYQRLGFAEEGLLRGEARLADGFDDLVPMGLALPERKSP